MALPNLKKLRTERLLSQIQLGEAIGISSRTLMRWEAGQGEPGASELLLIARFFGVSIDQLVGDLLPPESTGELPRVGDLSGRQLDYWVARSRGMPAEMLEDGPVMYVPGEGQQPIPAFSTDPSHANPIMESMGMHVCPAPTGFRFDGEVKQQPGWIARCAESSKAAWGRTMLEASMRAYLFFEIGDQVLT